MTKITCLFFAFVHLTACTGNSRKTDTQHYNVNYETYHNHRYDYTVEYPDFLIPQGEADSGDGQKFFSENEEIKLIVYRDYKDDFNADGENLPIDKAFEKELKLKEGVLNKKLENNHYIIEYMIDDRVHTDYVLFDEKYINLRFEYPEGEKNRMKDVIEHVIKSLKVEVWEFDESEQEANVSTGGLDDMFPAFLEGFLKECYWGKNINNLLRSNDKTLANYIDSKMDVRRYYAPGTIAKLGTRGENFGFATEDDFMFSPSPTGDLIFEYVNDDEESTPCELYYNELNDETYIIYYKKIKSVPDVVVNNETFETRPVKTAYPEAEIYAVYLPDAYNNPRGFYFFNTKDGWKLAFVDDSICGA